MATLATELHQRTGYIVLAHQLPQSTGQTISADAFPGISLIADSKREVPNGNLAAPVVGFTNAAGNGGAGLEYEYNKVEKPGSKAKRRFNSRPPG